MRGVEATGDMDVAQDFTRLLREADVDWEELLAGRIGDLAAHQLGRMARGFSRWGRETGEHLVRDLGEYLTEEVRMIPTHPELDEFLHAVDALRDDVERASARVSRLHRALGPEA
jgi:ubiquinone biosynthesis protein UbiJ